MPFSSTVIKTPTSLGCRMLAQATPEEPAIDDFSYTHSL
jgi:hypothetical protein